MPPPTNDKLPPCPKGFGDPILRKKGEVLTYKDYRFFHPDFPDWAVGVNSRFPLGEDYWICTPIPASTKPVSFTKTEDSLIVQWVDSERGYPTRSDKTGKTERQLKERYDFLKSEAAKRAHTSIKLTLSKEQIAVDFELLDEEEKQHPNTTVRISTFKLYRTQALLAHDLARELILEQKLHKETNEDRLLFVADCKELEAENKDWKRRWLHATDVAVANEARAVKAEVDLRYESCTAQILRGELEEITSQRDTALAQVEQLRKVLTKISQTFGRYGRYSAAEVAAIADNALADIGVSSISYQATPSTDKVLVDRDELIELLELAVHFSKAFCRKPRENNWESELARLRGAQKQETPDLEPAPTRDESRKYSESIYRHEASEKTPNVKVYTESSSGIAHVEKTIPDPFIPFWDKLPPEIVACAVNNNGYVNGFFKDDVVWYGENYWWDRHGNGSILLTPDQYTIASGTDWHTTLRLRPKI